MENYWCIFRHRLCVVVIFQEGALFPWLTVYENVEFGLKTTDLFRSERRD